MQHVTGIKYVPQVKVLTDFQGLWDHAKQNFISFDNQFEAQGYLNSLFNKEVETRILRIITEVAA
jgi:hypothetical protein